MSYEDGMEVLMSDLRSGNETYNSRSEIEDKIRAIAFARKFDEETEKRGKFNIGWWLGSERGKVEREISSQIDGKINSLKNLFR